MGKDLVDLACVAFTGVNSGSMGLVSDPDDEEWGFTGRADGKDSILVASACSSSSSYSSSCKKERTKRKSCKRSYASYAYTERDERTDLYIYIYIYLIHAQINYFLLKIPVFDMKLV